VLLLNACLLSLLLFISLWLSPETFTVRSLLKLCGRWVCRESVMVVNLAMPCCRNRLRIHCHWLIAHCIFFAQNAWNGFKMGRLCPSVCSCVPFPDLDEIWYWWSVLKTDECNFTRLDVLTAVKSHVVIFWIMAPCGDVAGFSFGSVPFRSV
jgi:hypothetical protein